MSVGLSEGMRQKGFADRVVEVETYEKGVFSITESRSQNTGKGFTGDGTMENAEDIDFEEGPPIPRACVDGAEIPLLRP